MNAREPKPQSAVPSGSLRRKGSAASRQRSGPATPPSGGGSNPIGPSYGPRFSGVGATGRLCRRGAANTSLTGTGCHRFALLRWTLGSSPRRSGEASEVRSSPRAYPPTLMSESRGSEVHARKGLQALTSFLGRGAQFAFCDSAFQSGHVGRLRLTSATAPAIPSPPTTPKMIPSYGAQPRAITSVTPTGR